MSEEKLVLETDKKVEKKAKKGNFFKDFFTKEYKFEGLILLTLAVISMVLGFMVINGNLTIDEKIYFIGEYPLVFAWILFILGVVSLLLSVYPFFKPSFSELKRVNWPTTGKLFKNVAIVFGYVLILSVFFIAADALFNQVVKLFQWLAGLMR